MLLLEGKFRGGGGKHKQVIVCGLVHCSSLVSMYGDQKLGILYGDPSGWSFARKCGLRSLIFRMGEGGEGSEERESPQKGVECGIVRAWIFFFAWGGEAASVLEGQSSL